jgi:ParB family transcriptional regulator, chromosome partitioning protein
VKVGSFKVQGQRVKLSDILVDREGRQRRDLDKGEIKLLAESMERVGQIHQIVLDQDNRLIAGERRLEAARLLGWETIEARLNTSIDPHELKLIELEENVKRADLSWQDEVRAIQALHSAWKEKDSSWTMEKTGAVVGFDKSKISDALGIAEELAAGNTQILKAQEMSQAKTAMKRARGRNKEEISKLLFDERQEPTVADDNNGPPSPPPEIITGDFLLWAKDYSGQKFSFIHCDFPYGVGMHKSGQVSKSLDLYDDTPELYFQLLSGFVDNFSNFAYPSCHIMFWFSMNFYEDTKHRLAKIPEARVFPYPLVWQKSDGRGMVPDPLREGRRTYETALMVSVGDRQIRKIVNNSISCPLDENRGHASRKPPKVLEHFFPLFIDDETRVLDPTCGSGSALQVAKGMGAKVLGLELNEEIVKGIKL